MNLARKLLAITVLVSVVAIGAITAATWHAASEAQHGLLRQRVVDDVNREARMLQGSIAMIASDLAVLAEGGAAGVAGEYSGPSVDNLQFLADQMDALMRKRPAYVEIRTVLRGLGAPRIVISRRNDDVVRTMVDPPTTAAGLDALLTERQGLRSPDQRFGPAQGDVSANARREVFLRVPVQDKAGSVVGAVAISADLQRVVGELGRPADDIGFWVADASGRLLHRSEAGSTPGDGEASRASVVDRFALREVWGAWLKSQEPEARLDSDTHGRFVVLRRVVIGNQGGADGETLVVGGVASYAALDAGATAFRDRVLKVVVGVGLLMVAALALAAGILVRPIEALTAAANRIAAGEPGVTAPIGRNDEIGILARAMVRMAEELRKAGKSSEQAAMGRMASMIAHDLRNALSSVKMNLQILEDHHRREGRERADNCAIALDQVRYMEVILHDMLAFARPGTVELDWVDVGEVLRTAAISLLPEQQLKSISLDMQGDHKLPTVLADRNKLLQLFQNLLENAIQASPDCGAVEVQARPLLHASRPAVEVRIRDHGPGFTAAAAAKAFEPFFTTKAKGTGLGLAIVQRIVRQHGGEITLATANGGGGAATVVLPLTPEEWESPRSGGSDQPG